MNARPDFNISAVRRSIADEIERLISILDAIDGSPDFEDAGDDEPWLGSVEKHPHGAGNRFPERGDLLHRVSQGSQIVWATGNRDNREIEEGWPINA